MIQQGYVLNRYGQIKMTNSVVAANLQVDGSNSDYDQLYGSINGSNTVFTVSKGLYLTKSLQVYKNGQLLVPGDDWSETSPTAGTFTMTTAPDSGDELTAVYQTALSASLAGWCNDFRAYATGNTSLSNNVWTKIGFATEHHDPDAVFASSRWTVNTSGLAVMSYAVGVTSNLADQAGCFSQIRKNGSATTGTLARDRLRKSGSSPESLKGSDQIRVSPGDYFEVWVKVTTTGSAASLMYTYPEDTYFTGHVLY